MHARLVGRVDFHKHPVFLIAAELREKESVGIDRRVLFVPGRFPDRWQDEREADERGEQARLAQLPMAREKHDIGQRHEADGVAPPDADVARVRADDPAADGEEHEAGEGEESEQSVHSE